MKKLYLFLIFILATFAVIAQTPQKMTYQAVVRNSANALIANQNVSARISIVQGSATGTVIYTETHQVTTNANGLMTVEIGGGTVVTGTFDHINWASGPYFLLTEIDPEGGINYSITTSQQLMSVPYALFAQEAANGFTGNYDDLSNIPNFAPVATSGDYNDLTNKPTIPSYQVLSISHDTLYLTNGGFVKLPVSFDGDYNHLINKPNLAPVATSGNYNDLTNRPTIPSYQVLSVSNDTLYLTNGGFVKLPGGFDGDYNHLTNKPNLFSGNYNDLTNKPTLFDGNYNNLTNKPNLAPVATSGNYNDLSNRPQIPTVPTNVSAFQNDAGYLTSFSEQQVLTISHDTIYLTGGSFVKLPTAEGFSGSYNDLTDKPQIPTVPTNVSAFQNDAGYLTSFSEQQVLTISNDTIYLTGGSFVKLPTAEGFSGSWNDLTDKPNIPTVPTDVSAFNNDAGYLTSFTESQILTISNDTIYLTGGSFVKLPTAEGFSGSYNDLTDKPQIPTVPTNVSAFQNDAGYITSFTEQQVLTISNDTIYLTGGSFVKLPTAEGFSGDYNDLNNKPNIPTVPTNVSAFTNDAGYLTSFQESQILTISHDTIYLTGGSFVKLPTAEGFSGSYNDLTDKPTLFSGDYNDLTNKPTFTESQILTISNDTIYLTGGSFVKLPAGFSGDYNDLTNQPIIPKVPNYVSSFENDMGYIIKDSIPTNVSAFTNDAGYITGYTETDPNVPAWAKEANKPAYDYAEIANTPAYQVLTISHDTIFLTNGGFVKLPTAEGFSGSWNDLTDKPSIPTVPTNVSAFTNDAGYLTSFTEQQVLTISHDTIYLTGGSFVKLPTAEGFSGSWNDLTDKPTIPTVPNDVSAFNNDAHYITKDSIPTNVSAFNNDAGYLTRDSLPTNVSAFANDAGYLTADSLSGLQNALNNLQQELHDIFNCGTDTVTDYDGNVYHTVKIGSQCWLRENIRSTHFSDGTAITDASTSLDESSTIPYYYNYTASGIALEQRGLLYNWPAAMRGANSPEGAQGICPTGWHVPTEAEWEQLTLYLSSQNEYACGSNPWQIAKALADNIWWQNSYVGCAIGNTPYNNNASGFSAVPAGYYTNGFFEAGYYTYIWLSTESSYGAYTFYLDYGSPFANVYDDGKNSGNSVRCLKDSSLINTLMNSIPSVNDGTLTIQQNGSTVGTFSANQSSDQTVNITVPSANDGTLTIQQNGSTVGTFSANQSSDQTVNITTLTAENVQAMINSSLGALQQQMQQIQADANFACGTSTVMDYDGNEYNTLRIGSQCWLKENLRSTHYANGTAIAAGTEASTTIPYRYAPGNNESNVASYGYLYNLPAVMNGASSSDANPSGVQGICPNGWHVPSSTEWMQLDSYVSSQNQYVCGTNPANIAKSLASTTGWTSNSYDCAAGNTPENNNATGFSAMPASFYDSFDDSYGFLGKAAYFWSSSNGATSSYGWCYIWEYWHSATTQITSIDKDWGLSVRCVRDNSEVSMAEQMQQQMNSLVAQQQQQIGSMQQNIDNLQHQMDSLQQVIDDGLQQIDSLQQVIEDGQQVSGGLPVVTITDVWQGDLLNNSTLYGSITSNGITSSRPNEFIVAKGFVYSSSNQNPTLQNSSFVTVDTNSSYFFKTINLYTNTTYYVRAFATNINGTSYSDPVTVRRGNYYAIPSTGSRSISISANSDTLYIYTYGGPDKNYGNYFNGSLTLYSSPSGKVPRIVSATYNTESTYDFLNVFTGASTSGTQLVHVSGSGSFSDIYPNNGDEALTIQFTSDVSNTRSGVLLKVILTNSCPATIQDVTGGTYYSTVRVKEQCWMKENLRTGNLTSGSTIAILTDYSTGSTTTPYRRYPNGENSNASTYSYLYNWPAVANNGSTVTDGMSGLCPSGWHIPTRQDVVTFYNNTTASFRTSSSGFNAKMAGRATYTNTTGYYDFGSCAYFWMTYSNTVSSFYINSSGTMPTSFTSGEGKAHYKSIRCLKD